MLAPHPNNQEGSQSVNNNMKQEGLKKSFVHAMQQKIFSGEYQIGQQWPPERELAQELGVSRSLVNTGILQLANKGFIRIIPRQGSIVADYKKNGTLEILAALMSCDSFRLDYPLLCNLVDLRVLVECECARLASLHASAEEIESLRVLVRCIKESVHPLDAVEPMAHPLGLMLVPRPDAVTERDAHEALLALAPETRLGLYLVPKVIE